MNRQLVLFALKSVKTFLTTQAYTLKIIQRHYICKNMDLENLDRHQAKELNIGLQTLQDIIQELQKPGFDPREDLPDIPFKEGLSDIKMLKEGSFVSGIVRNIADFGAFVDIGLKNDGMIHVSKMSTKRVKHPLEILTLNQYLPQIEVVSIDYESGKIGLSLI